MKINLFSLTTMLFSTVGYSQSYHVEEMIYAEDDSGVFYILSSSAPNGVKEYFAFMSVFYDCSCTELGHVRVGDSLSIPLVQSSYEDYETIMTRNQYDYFIRKFERFWGEKYRNINVECYSPNLVGDKWVDLPVSPH